MRLGGLYIQFVEAHNANILLQSISNWFGKVCNHAVLRYKRASPGCIKIFFPETRRFAAFPESTYWGKGINSVKKEDVKEPIYLSFNLAILAGFFIFKFLTGVWV